MAARKQEEPERYGIGAVTRRTGLSAPGLRMWEKRYGVVVPGRTETNRRVYTAEDLERLVLLKQLTDRGHAIRNIATLKLDELKKRLAEAEPAVKPSRAGPAPACWRIVAIGSDLPASLGRAEFFRAETVRAFDDLSQARSGGSLPEADLLVISVETLMPPEVAAIRDVVSRSKAPRTLVIYRFCSSRTAADLMKGIGGLSLLKAPVSDRRLQRECVVHLNSLPGGPPSLPGDESAEVPERRYSPEQLAGLSRMTTVVECECPQHLAELLQGLCAFEQYSSECEDQNEQDALLHAFLHRTTASVRHTMEAALTKVLEAEGISLR